MGIKEDYSELKATWQTLSPPSKVFFGATFLVSLFSIASISDAVVGVVGFLKTAVIFYRELTLPTYEWLGKLFSINVPPHQGDGIIFVLSSVGAVVRVRIVSWNTEYNRASEIILVVAMALASSTVFLGVKSYAEAAILCIIISAAIIFLDVFSTKSVNRILLLQYGSDPEGLAQAANLHAKRQVKMTIAYLLALFLVLAIVAAISDGLQRAYDLV